MVFVSISEPCQTFNPTRSTVQSTSSELPPDPDADQVEGMMSVSSSSATERGGCGNGDATGATDQRPVDLETYIQGISPAVAKFRDEDDDYLWETDEEYFQAIVACETLRVTARRLQANLAGSIIATNNHIFAGPCKSDSKKWMLSGQELAVAIQQLADTLEAKREKKLAAILESDGEHRVPIIEAFLTKLEASPIERKVFRHVLVQATFVLPGSDSQYEKLTHVNHLRMLRDVDNMYGGYCPPSASALELNRMFSSEEGLTLASLMQLFDEDSRFVKERIYRLTLKAHLPVSQMSGEVLNVFMGVSVKAAQYNAIDSKTLQLVLREDSTFAKSEVGKTILEQQEQIESVKAANESGGVVDVPAPLELALKDAKADGRDLFEVLSAAVKAEKRTPTESPTPTSEDDGSREDKAEEAQIEAGKEEPSPDKSDYGPYENDLKYLEDQVRLMKATLQVRKLREGLHSENEVDAAMKRTKDRRNRQMYGADPSRLLGRNKEEMNDSISADADKLEIAATKLKERIKIRLGATKEANGNLPRLEQLQSALSLDEFEKFLLLTLVMEVLQPGADDLYDYGEYGGAYPPMNVGGYINSCATTLEQRMLYRNYFYKNATLVKEGIISITQNDFTVDLTRSKVQLDRRMLDFIVGLDTELAEMVDGSHLYMPDVNLDDVILPKETKDRVCESVLQFPVVKDKMSKLDVDRKFTYGSGQILLFYGSSGTGKTMMANALATTLKKKVLLINFPSLGVNESGEILRYLFREARINSAVLFFDECESMFLSRDKGGRTINMLLTEIERFDGLCILATNRPCDLDEALHRRISLSIEFEKPDHILREEIWRKLHPPKLALDDSIDFADLARRFELSGGHIKNCWLSSIGFMVQREDDKIVQDDLVKAAKEQVVGRLSADDFDRRVVPTCGIDAMVLSDDVKTSLTNIVEFSKAQTTLYGSWGFDKLHRSSTGISAIFTGPPGTGKSMAAEAIGFDIGKPLLVVNVAELTSKWVGETGKNIQSVFDDAKNKDAILVFDEAEGLFGQRGSGSSTSRHDNLNVGLLLQKIETFSGICLVITNMKEAIDEAFFRRFRFVLDFEPPNQAEREKLWKLTIPEEMPLGGDVSLKALAQRYEMSGGGIKSALFRAATRAALRHSSSERKVTMKDLETACTEETRKTGTNQSAANMYA